MIGMGLSKSKCDNKRVGKRISQIIVRQKKSTFFGKEVLRKMCEKSNDGSEGRKRVNYVNLCQ
jgi:hypothetical protein